MMSVPRTVMVSASIVTWNSAAYIRDCLRSLLDSGPRIQLEITVVDNASSDETVSVIQREFPHIRLIQNETNLGYTRAMNQGIAGAQGDFILQLNPDTILFPGALETMVDFLQMHPEVGLVGPQLLDPDGTVQPSCREFPTFRTLVYEMFGLSWLFPRSPRFGHWRMGYFDHLTSRVVDQPMGACVLIRKDVMAQIGQLDERFFMFYSDVDLCVQVQRLGYQNYFLVDAQVTHYKGVSVKRRRPAMIYSAHQSMYAFLKKYYANQPLKLALSKAILFIGSGLRISWDYSTVWLHAKS
ncbi:MAG: glycosyltransferase family 2 protein [Gemmatimonadetes bacterium]|nr:MAG: glycosyltransferase family 2 protein [Gemmatimonadota bacterium]